MHTQKQDQFYPIGATVSSEELSRDPYPIYARLREAEPISWLPALGMWYVTRYEDVQRILLDTEHFVTGTEDSLIYDTFGSHMLTVEGADHDRYKAAARSSFMPKNIKMEMGTKIQALANGLIDNFAPDGRTELRASFASRLPVQTMLALFGLPLEEERHLRRWYNSFEAALANFTRDPAIQREAHQNVAEFHALIESYMRRFKASPNASLLSVLVNAAEDNRLRDDEIKRNVSIMLFGGISTVEALILNTLYALNKHPDVLVKLRDDSSLLPVVLEEVIRWLSPVQSATRHVTKDITVKGVTFNAGDTVNCMLGSANHDPAMFPSPEHFNVHRSNIHRHMGFAIGTHHCLGSHLAKAEARIAIETLLHRLPGLAMDQNYLCEPAGYEFRQPLAMHLTWAKT